MKVFKHTWDQEIFLLHIQLDNSMQENYQFTISKNFGSAPDKRRVMKSMPTQKVIDLSCHEVIQMKKAFQLNIPTMLYYKLSL